MCVLPTLLVATGCGGGGDVIDPGGSGDGLTVVPHGKEDNFFAPAAREYLVEGRTEVVLSEADADLSESERLEKALRLIPFKQIAVGWFLLSYIAPKDGKDKNADYGGFNALTKNGSYEELRINALADGRTFRFTFRQEIGGPLDLLAHLPVSSDASGKMTFDLVVGKVDNETMQRLEINEEWYRKVPWKNFDPSKMSADQIETISLTISPQPRSNDAWFEYDRLFEDGKVTIGIHFGWDYHAQDHLKDSRRTYNWLVKHGFQSPVSEYDQLGRKSGNFTKTISANGRSVAVEVALFWGKPGTDTDPDTDSGGKLLEKDMVASLGKREVIMFQGHSGPFYGFALANWKKTDEGDLDDAELAGLSMPETYQLVLAEGCETYALGQAFFSNPAKTSRTNLDIVTTTTYSTASLNLVVESFLEALIGVDSDNNHIPWTFGELLANLDYATWEPAMYGVHGVDDNPHLHPYADSSWFCERCSTDWDCGTQNSNTCVNLGTDGSMCTAACTADDGCPSGYTCAAVRKGQSLTGRVCVPSDYSCDGPVPSAPAVIINELLADPQNGALGDTNGDGFWDYEEDEFVEIVNTTSSGIDLAGWSVADNVKVRFTFPNITLKAGGVAVVFGGGNIGPLEAAPGALVFLSDDGLSLANSGDSVILRNGHGLVADRVTYGPEADDDRSLTREEPGDGDSEFVPSDADTLSTPGVL